MKSENIKFDNTNSENVANIQLSEETKTLLTCKACYNDIYNTISNVINKLYREDAWTKYEGFYEAYSAFESKMNEVLIDVINDNTINSGSKEL